MKWCGSSCRDVLDGGLAVPTIHLGVEADLLALCQTSDSSALEGRRMDKDVGAAAIRLNESEAFLVVEEFHCTRVHVGSFQSGSAQWRAQSVCACQNGRSFGKSV